MPNGHSALFVNCFLMFSVNLEQKSLRITQITCVNADPASTVLLENGKASAVNRFLFIYELRSFIDL